ncbi:MAG: L-serine ammonia-lyase [Betaproteobacteria bacterium]|nr:MAG: L-serine ammonia-lyase [Betaproteobacteria bacterium]
MVMSVFELFKIGVGPSSSHTVGPMLACLCFVRGLQSDSVLQKVDRLRVELFGSLAATGKGHCTDKAVLMGLEGEAPETIDPASIDCRVDSIRAKRQLTLLGRHLIRFDEQEHLIFNRCITLPFHPNGLKITAYDAAGAAVRSKVYYSVGGGFIVEENEVDRLNRVPDEIAQPFPFSTARELIRLCEVHDLRVSDLMLENEKAWRTEAEIRNGLLGIWQVMQECVSNGCRREGYLPGNLGVRRRAPELFGRLSAGRTSDDLSAMDWVNLFALAVNEENASGGRVVTAPTNGAAGIIPAVMHYYARFVPEANDDGIVRFLLTAAAIGVLYKLNASISAAEVGCQGEIGSACSMASAALAEVMGGSRAQVENAAEIGMEHNLGLTCDPVGGLVQVPCIERNAIAAVKAINAARMALNGDGKHVVSLDQVIKTMRDTGADMKRKYKETARGGLAVNVSEC